MSAWSASSPDVRMHSTSADVRPRHFNAGRAQPRGSPDSAACHPLRSILMAIAVEQPITSPCRAGVGSNWLHPGRRGPAQKDATNSTRLRRCIVAQALAVDMADHGGALRAARPVLAGAILGGAGAAVLGVEPVSTSCRFGAKPRRRGMISPRSRQRIVRRSLVVGLIRSSTAVSRPRALEVLPRAVADALETLMAGQPAADSSKPVLSRA